MDQQAGGPEVDTSDSDCSRKLPLDGVTGSPKKKKMKEQKDKAMDCESSVVEDGLYAGNSLELFLDDISSSPKKKKKKHRRNEDRALEDAYHFKTPMEPCADNVNSSQMEKKKKKKKKHKRNEDRALEDAYHFETPMEPVVDDLKNSPQKKKKKHRRNEDTALEDPYHFESDREPVVDDLKNSPQKKKKKHRRNEDTALEDPYHFESDREPVVDDLKNSPQKKKKKHRRNEDTALEDPYHFESDREPVVDDLKNSPQKKKKKHRRNEDTALEDPYHFESDLEPVVDDLKNSPQKKKKKHRRNEDTALEDLYHFESDLEPVADADVNSSLEKKKKHQRNKDHALEDTCNSEIAIELVSDDLNSSSKRKIKEEKERNVSLSEGVTGSGSPVEPLPEELLLSPQKTKKTRKSEGETQDAEEQTLDKESGTDRVHTKGKAEKKRKRCEFQATDDGDQSATHHGEGDCILQLQSVSNQTSDSDKGEDENVVHVAVKSQTPKDTVGTENVNGASPRKHRREASEGRPTSNESNPQREDQSREWAKSCEQPYRKAIPCYICQEDMASKEEYVQHLAEKHDKRSYQCPKCQSPLSSPKLLNLHLKTSCPSKDSECMFAIYSCSLCPLSYTHSVSLSRHKRMEHGRGRAPTIHRCLHCSREFSSAQRLTGHSVKCAEGLLQKPPGEQCLECPLCRKMFSSKQSRSYHIRTIHREHVFDCVCGKQFRASTYYYAHRKVCTA